MRRRARAAGALACALTAGIGIAGAALHEGGRAGAPPRQANAVPVSVGQTPPATRIQFLLSLRRNDRALEQVLEGTGSAGLPTGERTVAAAAVGRRFGLPLSAIARVRRVLTANGITVVRTYPERTVIDAEASVATLSRFFGVSYRDYVDGSGTRFHAPVGTVRIPHAIDPFVRGVVGLSTRPLQMKPKLRTGGLYPIDARTAYNVEPLIARQADGRGKTIAIVSFQAFVDDDVKAFRDHFGITGPKPTHIKVDGGATGKGHDEVSLDVDVISGVAPQAQIVVYEAPNTGKGAIHMLDAVARSNVDAVSYSWGMCDSGLPAAYRDAIQAALKTASVRGITVYVASGDNGAYDCQGQKFSNHEPTVDFPSDSPWAVSVGGTLLSVGSDGSYLKESVWQGSLSNQGGGGGINRLEARPAWQIEAGVGDARYRSVPDVSAAASQGSPWLAYFDGGWRTMWGTSASAPFWTAAMVVAQQYADRGRSARRCFTPPVLYALARTAGVYHDVTTGANRFYPAQSGWDYGSGLGSPNVYNLARSLGPLLDAMAKKSPPAVRCVTR
jgi:subtilase family serine protease